jgi:Tol biopolymer transport system component
MISAGRWGRHMRNILGLLVLILALSGCQGLAARTPVPTLTPVALPTATGARVPTALSAAISAPHTPAPAEATATPLLAPTASPAPVPPAASPTPTSTRLMAIGAGPALLLRAAPALSAAAAQTVPGSTVLWTEGQTADGAWLLVSYGKPTQRAWARRVDLSIFGDPARLPVVDTAAQPPVATASQPAALQGGGRLYGRISGDQVNVRVGPGVDQPVSGGLVAGAAVTLTARSIDGEWLQLAWPAGPGWIAARYVVVSGDTALLPAVRPATTVSLDGRAREAGTGGPSGKVAFQIANDADIYVVNADGSGLRRVAAGFDPALSPDGQRLAYTHWSQAGDGVYVLDLRTSQELKVADAAHPRWPVWSPDGTRLVFSRFVRSTDCLRTPLGCRQESEIRKVFGGKDCIDTPFGRFCISGFQRSSEVSTGLTQVTLAGGAQQDLVAQLFAQAPSWRPGSEQIVYRGSKNLLRVTPEGDLTVFVDDTQVNSPAWSPDGQLMAGQKHMHDHDDIFLYNAAGQVQARLTQPPFLVDHAPNNVAPAWSADGRYILFLTDRDGDWRVYRMNADGSGQAPFLTDVLSNLHFRYDFAAEHMLSCGR